MLDTDRPVISDLVEGVLVEHPGDGLVVADPANPVFTGCGLQGRFKFGARRYRRWATCHGTSGGGQGEQVDVVVVQARKQGATPSVEAVFVGRSGKAATDFDDPAVAAAHIQVGGTTDVGVDDQKALAMGTWVFADNARSHGLLFRSAYSAASLAHGLRNPWDTYLP